MTAQEKHQKYMEALEGLTEEQMKKMIKDGGMTPAILIDIARSLATIADALNAITGLLREGGRHERKTSQGPG